MRRWFLLGGFLLLLALVASFAVVHRRDTRPVNAVGSVESAPEARETAVLRGSSERSAQEPATVLPIAVGALVHAAIPLERARVSGLVLDASGGVVGGATLRATSVGQSDTMVSTVSDLEGRFHLGLAEAGVVDIHVSAEAYSDVVVRAQAPVQGLIVALAPSSRIVGRVETEEAGAGVADVTVLASNEDGLKLPPRTVQTSADGSFELASLAAGGYSLVAHGDTWRSLPIWVSVGVAGTAEALLQVRRATTLDGVVNVAGEPCKHGQVVLTGPISEARALGPGGAARFEGLFPGHYDVSISCSLDEANGEEAAKGSPAFAAADAVGGEDAFEIGSEPVRRVWSLHTPEVLPEAIPTGTIVVVVRGEQARVDAVTVLLAGSGGAAVRGRREGNLFRFTGLEPGDYHAFLEQFPSIRARAALSASGDVEVSLDAPSVTTMTIAGKVSDESGAPVPDAWVHAESVTVLASNYTVGSAVLTDGDGAFTLAALPAGSYRIVAEGVLGRASMDRVASGTRKLALTIRESASISGSVVDTQQRAVARFVLNYRLRGSAEVIRINGHDGRWALPSIAPGTYQLFVIAEQGSGFREITVEPGSHVSTSVTLEAADSQRSMKFFMPSEPQARAGIE